MFCNKLYVFTISLFVKVVLWYFTLHIAPDKPLSSPINILSVIISYTGLLFSLNVYVLCNSPFTNTSTALSL